MHSAICAIHRPYCADYTAAKKLQLLSAASHKYRSCSSLLVLYETQIHYQNTAKEVREHEKIDTTRVR